VSAGSEIERFALWLGPLIEVLERSDPATWDPEIYPIHAAREQGGAIKLQSDLVCWLDDMRAALRGGPAAREALARTDVVNIAAGVLVERLRAREQAAVEAARPCMCPNASRGRAAEGCAVYQHRLRDARISLEDALERAKETPCGCRCHPRQEGGEG
jgi:hypothetical protein